MKKCRNCKYRMFSGWDGMLECCIDYEMSSCEEDEIKAARDCPRYEEGKPSCLEEDDYCPSSTYGDYSPSNPWDAPGMSIRDFI